MQSFKLESSKERKERHMDGAWNIENFKLKNISQEKAEKYAREYWIVGLVSVGLSVVFYLFQGNFGDFVFDLILSLVLIFLIYKRFVWAAIIFLIYFIFGKIYLFMTYPQYVNIGTIVASFYFLSAYIFGTLGVIKLKQLKKVPAVNVGEVSNVSFCHNCGKPVNTGVKFCSGCGTPVISK